MRDTWELVLALTLATCIGGCGLSLDTDPPDPVPGAMDASIGADGGVLVLDGGVLDGGPPPCRTDVDCDDDDACTGLERCAEGVCLEGDRVICPDDDVCDGALACDAATGACTIVIDSVVCDDDGDPCNGEEHCDPVIGCTVSPPPDCDDAIACTMDACGADGCTHSPVDALCDAELGGECLVEGGCQYPTCVLGVTCVAEHPCQIVSCEGDTCVREDLACAEGQQCCGGTCVAAGCDDGDACTADHCERAVGCVHAPATGSCEDGDPCTIGDRCVSGRCAAGGPRCASGTDPCLRATCDASTGACSTAPSPSGTPCSDGNACSIGDACLSGTCRAGTGTPTCDDLAPCTQDRCESSIGCVSSPLPDDTACSTTAGSAGTCAGGRCLFPCPAGTADCDGDGSCECNGSCGAAGPGLPLVCMASTVVCTAVCGPGSYCCSLMGSADYGRCIAPDETCLGGTCCVATSAM